MGICKLDSGVRAYRSTVRIGPHQCGHRTGAVHSSEKHRHAVLKHRLALLESYDSSTAASAVNGHSVVLVTVLGHCQALPYDPVTAFLKDFTEYGQFRSKAPSIARQCSYSLSYLAQNLLIELWLGLHGHCF